MLIESLSEFPNIQKRLILCFRKFRKGKNGHREGFGISERYKMNDMKLSEIPEELMTLESHTYNK